MGGRRVMGEHVQQLFAFFVTTVRAEAFSQHQFPAPVMPLGCKQEIALSNCPACEYFCGLCNVLLCITAVNAQGEIGRAHV